MKSDRHKTYTVNNNVNATHNLLNALVATETDAHVVHLGTMGVYGYSTAGASIPEGYLTVDVTLDDGGKTSREILYPTDAGSIYHMTKCLDQVLFQFYAKNDGVRITDLHQGIVWGTHTDQTRRHEQLINRFDYDGDYGTVLNRFLIQAALHHPLTVHGTGGQSRAFIHIQDSVRCIEIALNNPPERGERTKIFNQMTEVHRVRDLAKLVSELTGADIVNLPNPRKEAAENELSVKNDQFVASASTPSSCRPACSPNWSMWPANTSTGLIGRAYRALRPGPGRSRRTWSPRLKPTVRPAAPIDPVRHTHLVNPRPTCSPT